MAGYIGKISAVVTANTSMLSRELTKSAQDADKFARSLRNSINRGADAASASIEKIFTPLQMLERKLQQAASRGLNLNMPSDKIRALVSVAEQINKPLEAASGSFQKLSAGIQSGFAPALARAQSQAEAFFKIIEVGRAPTEAYFGVVESRVERTTQALRRLTQAQQAASKGFTGNELQFTNPDVFATLNRSSALTGQAAGLPEVALASGDIGNRVAKLNGLSQSIASALARLESIRLTPKVDTVQIEKAEADLKSLLATAKATQEGLQSAIDVQGNIGASTPFMSTRDPQGRTIQQRLAANLLRDQLAQENEIVAGQQELGRKIGNGFLTILTPAEAAADTLQAHQQELGRRIGNGFLTILTPAEAAADTLQAHQQELGRRIGNGFLTILTQAEAAADTVAGRVSNARRRGASDLRDSFGGRTEAGINFGFEQKALRGYESQLRVLQQAIGSAAAEARGPAVSAFSRLRDAIADAMDRGELETIDTRDEIRRLTQDAIAASARVAGVSERGLSKSVARAGDVGRRGFDRLSLAINQAAFAIDDFFSSTGGLEFKLRAVQNNLTQLGFVLDGTRGLFLALGAAIGGQLVIQIFKWANGNVELSDKVKAANSELEKQKQLVDALAKSYQALAESAKAAGASEAGRNAAERRRQVEEIRRQEEEARRSRIAAVDPESIRLRTEINKLERENENESRAGIAADRQRRIQILERQLAEAERRAASQQTNAQDVADAITTARLRAAEAVEASFDNRMFTNVGVQGGQVTPLEATRRARDEVLQRIRGEPLGDISTPEAQLEAINQAIEDLSEQTASRQRGFSFLRDPFGSLESQLDQSLQELLRRAEIIRSAIEDQRSSEALIRFSETSLEIADILSRARDRISDSEDTFLSATADEFAAERERLSQRAVEAREQGDLEFAAAVNELAEKLERLAREFDTVALVTSAASTAIERLSGDLNQQVLQEAEQLADQARRDQNALWGRLNALMMVGDGVEITDREALGLGFNKDRAEEIFRDARERAARVEAANQAAVRDFRDRAIAGDLGGELAQSFAERERLQAQIDAGGLDARAAEAVQDRINELDRLIQQQFEATPEGQAAVRRADKAERQFRRDVERRDAVLRGADALVTDGERAGFEAARRFSDITALFEAIPDFNTPDARRQQARILEDAQRQIAPALFALTDGVANAVLQGPSRQALNASDISTSQGTAEFLRLLRGDDSSRDQNLIELQRQTEELRRLNATFDAGVAN
jgi:hypothetical protein